MGELTGFETSKCTECGKKLMVQTVGGLCSKCSNVRYYNKVAVHGSREIRNNANRINKSVGNCKK
jgi:hypothetical protein